MRKTLLFALGMAFAFVATYTLDGRPPPYHFIGNLTLAGPGDHSIGVYPDKYDRFLVRANINGVGGDFLLDTGASAVVLSRDFAAQAGLKVSLDKFTQTATTANGQVLFAWSRANRIEVGPLVVEQVPVAIQLLKPGEHQILGMAFLKKLKRFGYENGRLVLEQ